MKTKKLTKAVLYDALTDQGIHLPKLKSSICNMEYLIRVKNCIEYCPKVHEVPDLICLAPPKKMILLSIIEEELSKRGDHRVITYDEKHTPDVDWCLHAVSALNPQHQIFDQGAVVLGESGEHRPCGTKSEGILIFCFRPPW